MASAPPPSFFDEEKSGAWSASAESDHAPRLRTHAVIPTGSIGKRIRVATALDCIDWHQPIMRERIGDAALDIIRANTSEGS